MNNVAKKNINVLWRKFSITVYSQKIKELV